MQTLKNNSVLEIAVLAGFAIALTAVLTFRTSAEAQQPLLVPDNIDDSTLVRVSEPGLYPQFSNEQLSELSDIIVTGSSVSRSLVIQEVTSRNNDEAIAFFIIIEFKVDNYVSGSGPKTISIILNGQPNRQREVEAVEKERFDFDNAERYLLYLSAADDLGQVSADTPNLYYYTGGAQGRFTVSEDKAVPTTPHLSEINLSELADR